MSHSESDARANVCKVSHLFGHDDKDKSASLSQGESFSSDNVENRRERKVLWDLVGKRFI